MAFKITIPPDGQNLDACSPQFLEAFHRKESVNLNYEKIKARVEGGGHHWTSYSDLFLVLSVVFLLLYAVANLRSGAGAILQARKLTVAEERVKHLESQVQMFEAARDDALRRNPSADEIVQYNDLMTKLHLLEGNAANERAKLEKDYNAARRKEQDLNRYQAMVKRIIEANLVANSKMRDRDQVIAAKQAQLAESTQAIENLAREVDAREKAIRATQMRAEEIASKLEAQKKETVYAQRSKKNAQEKLRAEMESVKAQSQREMDALQNSLKEKELAYRATISGLTQQHEAKIEEEKERFKKEVQAANLTAQAKIEKERAYRSAVERQQSEYKSRLSKLEGELGSTQKRLTELKPLEAVAARELERQNVARKLKKAMQASGLDAKIDERTGEMTVAFEEEYFDKGSSSLKPGMVSKLEKIIPLYAKTIFEDPKLASRITTVDLVGFASPTYNGRYVNPDSMDEQDRKAVNFNMNLSFKRAKSIFDHVFDPSQMQFEHQKQMLRLVKVSGRSYLATDRQATRSIASHGGKEMSDGEFCSKFDCQKAQQVLIRFNLKED